jgi:oligopeptide/dipeptide ABC transporter ATP-binding protein
MYENLDLSGHQRPQTPVDGVILRVENLTKYFLLRRSRESIAAVNGVNLHISEGETLALVGETGSGKTTVGRCILRLEEPTSGNIEILGRDVTRLPEKDLHSLRSAIQMVFQDPHEAFDPRWRIEDIVGEPLRWALGMRPAERRQRVHEVLEMVRLPVALLRRFPDHLTPGEKQRVGIARAIATKPDLVILDEPTSRLDVAVRAKIIELLASLQAQLGIAYLFISHDLTAVQRISHRIAVMYLGKIAETGPTKEVYRRPFHPYTKALLASALFPDPDFRSEKFELRGEIPSPVNLPKACYLASRCPMAIERCRLEEPTLREIEPGRSAACHRAEEVGRLVVETTADPRPSP